jgi:hypothetical protein
MPALVLTSTVAAELGHNTSASAAYNKTNNAANFTGTTKLTVAGLTQAVSSAIEDDSWNPVTPAHVSNTDIHTLFPGKKVRCHVTPWFGQTNHASIGVNYNTTAWANATIADMKRRGFDGCIIDWYGSGRPEDATTLKLQTAIAAAGSFDYIIMVDQGGYSTLAGLQTELSYLQTQYLSDPNYATQGGKPILQFFGLPLSSANYTTAKAAMTTACHWMVQGTSPGTYADGTFDWVQPWSTGIPSDRYNAAATNAYLTGMHSSALTSMPCISPKFNGYVTGVKEAGYKEGYILPPDSGKCWLSQAATVAANYPTNMIGIQVATWSDWEEGTPVEPGIDNAIVVAAHVTGNVLSWSVSGGTGDESTIASYALWASPDGVNLGPLGTQATGGSKTFDLTTITGWATGAYQLYVIAIGQSCIINRSAPTVAYTAPTITPPPPPPPPTVSTFSGNITGTFTINLTPGAKLVPLDPAANQTWQASVQVNGEVLTFFVYLHFNEIAGYWVMSVYDSARNPLLASVPLVTGLNVFQQHQSLGIGSMYILNASGTPQDSPDDTDLGNDFVMVWDDAASLELALA